jgi:hypothetical protein
MQSLFFRPRWARDFFCPDSWNSHEKKAHRIKVLLQINRYVNFQALKNAES